jgi:hypothetical protein
MPLGLLLIVLGVVIALVLSVWLGLLVIVGGLVVAMTGVGG